MNENLTFVNKSPVSLLLYACAFDDEEFNETGIMRFEDQKYETTFKILPQRTFEVCTKALHSNQVWLGLPLAALNASEGFPPGTSCLWTPWDPSKVAEIASPQRNPEVLEPTTFYSVNVDTIVRPEPSHASSATGTLKKYLCFQTNLHCYSDTRQVWAKVDDVELQGWICVSSTTNGELDVIKVALKHASETAPGEFSKYFRNVFIGKSGRRLPVRQQPDLKSAAAGSLKGFAVLPAESCVKSAGHQIWVKVCSMDLSDGAAWAIVRSATLGTMALEPCLGPGSDDWYYRNCFSKGALQLRTAPSNTSEVACTFPLGTCFLSQCRVFANQQIWVSTVRPDTGTEAWVTEIDEETGGIYLNKIDPPGQCRRVYRNIHSGTLPVMDGIGYGPDTKSIGTFVQGRCFVGIERRLSTRNEMWIKVLPKDGFQGVGEMWVPESISGITSSVEPLDSITADFDWNSLEQLWQNHTAVESFQSKRQEEDKNSRNNSISQPTPEKQKKYESAYSEQSYNSPQQFMTDRMLSEEEELASIVPSNTARQKQKDDFDFLKQLDNFAEKERMREKDRPLKGDYIVAPPLISPSSGTYGCPLTIEISCKAANGRILYCFDEKYPRWTEYERENHLVFSAAGKAKVTAKVVLPWGQESEHTTTKYILQENSKSQALWQQFVPNFFKRCPCFAPRKGYRVVDLAEDSD